MWPAALLFDPHSRPKGRISENALATVSIQIGRGGGLPFYPSHWRGDDVGCQRSASTIWLSLAPIPTGLPMHDCRQYRHFYSPQSVLSQRRTRLDNCQKEATQSIKMAFSSQGGSFHTGTQSLSYLILPVAGGFFYPGPPVECPQSLSSPSACIPSTLLSRERIPLER